MVAHCGRLLALVALWASVLSLHGASLRYVTPLGDGTSVPLVDGIIQEAEWRNSLRLGGLLRPTPNPSLVSEGEGTVNFAVTGGKLYIGFRVPAKNFDPGGGLKSDAKTRDSQVYHDDSVELVMVPEVPGERRMYHFIFNPDGTIFDRRAIGSGEWDLAWNCPGLRCESRVVSGWWELETVMPLESLGNPKDCIKLNACRSFAYGRPSGIIASLSYFDTGTMFDLVWRKDAPAIQMTGLGKPLNGDWALELAVSAAPRGKRYFADMELVEYPEGSKTEKSVMLERGILTAGKSLRKDFQTVSRNPLRVELNVRDGDSGEFLFSRRFYAQRGVKTDGVPPTLEFDLEGIGVGVVYYYPSLNRARVTVMPGKPEALGGLEVELGGKRIALRAEAGGYSGLVPVPQQAGKHSATVRIAEREGKRTEFPQAFTLEKRTFVWEGNNLGKDQIVIPPFKPIVRKGESLQVILRNYAFNSVGLLKSVRALDREILAEEVHYELVSGGRSLRLAGKAPRLQVLENGCAAEVQAQAEAPNGMRLTSRGRLEYDGFLWNQVTLSQVAGRTIDRLTLVMPLKDDQVPLFHATAIDTIRHNPTGTLPSGEGVIWSGDTLPRNHSFLEPMYAKQVVPYVWLGAERRGLCWFINNTAGLRLAEDRPAVRIIRRGKVVRVEIDIINRTTAFKGEHSFAFGLQATPVKPQERRFLRHFQSGYSQHPTGMMTRMEIYECTVGYFTRFGRHPWKHEWDLFEKGYQYARTGQGREVFRQAIRDWFGKHGKDLQAFAGSQQNMGSQTYLQWMEGYLKTLYSVMLQIKEPVYPFKYSDPTLTWDGDETAQYFKSEWISRPSTYRNSLRLFLTPSYRDYIIYSSYQELKHGLKGVYFDDMFPMTCRNADISAVVDEEGVAHGNLGILEMRDLVKRTAVMQHKLGISPRFLQIHMTNCLLVPSFAFATSQLSWEDHFGEADFQERYAMDYIRAESIGTQLGLEAVALDGIMRKQTPWSDWDAKKAWLTRTQMAVILPIGVRIWARLSPQNIHRGMLMQIWNVLGAFKIWEDDCRFVSDFDDDGAIAAPDDVLVGSYRRRDRVLVLFGNYSKEDRNMAFKADWERLGLPSTCRLTNAETKEVLDPRKLRLKGHDLLMVLVERP